MCCGHCYPSVHTALASQSQYRPMECTVNMKGKLVGLVFQMIESCFSGNKSVSATGGFACISNPCVNGSCDQCIVSQLHEIMSIVAFYVKVRRKCPWFSFLSCRQNCDGLFIRNRLCSHPRHFKAPVDHAAAGPWQGVLGRSSCQTVVLNRRRFSFPLLSCRTQVS